MNLSAAKVYPNAPRSEAEIEVVNFKTDDKTEEFIKKGVLPCYHMNKKSWVTVALDGTLPMDLIRELAELSYINSQKKGKRSSED